MARVLGGDSGTTSEHSALGALEVVRVGTVPRAVVDLRLEREQVAGVAPAAEVGVVAEMAVSALQHVAPPRCTGWAGCCPGPTSCCGSNISLPKKLVKCRLLARRVTICEDSTNQKHRRYFLEDFSALCRSKDSHTRNE